MNSGSSGGHEPDIYIQWEGLCSTSPHPAVLTDKILHLSLLVLLWFFLLLVALIENGIQTQTYYKILVFYKALFITGWLSEHFKGDLNRNWEVLYQVER